jgi:hypothetical protein
MATIPIIYNKWISTPDTTWFTPAIIFHKKVLGDGIVDEASFLDKLHDYTSRMTSPSEIKLLQKIAFIGIGNNSPLLMIKVEDLAQTLQVGGAMCDPHIFACLPPSLACLLPLLNLATLSSPACLLPFLACLHNTNSIA